MSNSLNNLCLFLRRLGAGNRLIRRARSFGGELKFTDKGATSVLLYFPTGYYMGRNGSRCYNFLGDVGRLAKKRRLKIRFYDGLKISWEEGQLPVLSPEKKQVIRVIDGWQGRDQQIYRMLADGACTAPAAE